LEAGEEFGLADGEGEFHEAGGGEIGRDISPSDEVWGGLDLVGGSSSRGDGGDGIGDDAAEELGSGSERGVATAVEIFDAVRGAVVVEVQASGLASGIGGSPGGVVIQRRAAIAGSGSGELGDVEAGGE
jgi:hypothetical protein